MRPGEAKSSGLWQWVAVAAILLLGLSYLGYLDLQSIFSRPGPMPGEEPVEDLVAVNKPLEFAVIDKFAGSAVSSASVYVYEGKALLETLTTDANGLATTSLKYRSGTQLNILVVNGNSKMWKSITVPKMAKADAESMSVNSIRIDFFTVASLSLQVRDGFGNSYVNAGNLNKTALGQNIISLTVSWFVANDNTGFLSSYDPINELDWRAVMYVKLSGTNYEVIQLTGLDESYAIGTTNWFASTLADTEVTKYKVGNQYVHPGSGSRTFTLDLTSYSGDLADLDIYIVFYSSSAYHRAKGGFGPDALTVVQFTLNLVD